METHLEWENIHEIVLEVLDYCENVVNAEGVNNANDYDDISAHIEDVIDLLNQISVQPVFHNNEMVQNTIHQCRENLFLLRSYFVSQFLQLEHGIRTYEYLQPSNIATLLNHPAFENENEGGDDDVIGNRPGRPKYHIPKSVLVNLREMGYTWTQISEMLLVSRWTIARRVAHYELEGLQRFTNIADDELRRIMISFINEHGNFVGFSLMYGHLKSLGLKIKQKRIKDMLRTIDPESSRLRWALVVSRRSYSVAAPNSLWHIDGHHSLVTWGFVIHGGIDGYSRLIVMLKCSTNNHSVTVGDLFCNAIERYGIPSRVRTDHGGENVLIWQMMEEMRGMSRGSALRGTSTQNQRIERLWRDVFRCVTCIFYYLFQSMESTGLLDRNNPLHMYILHFVFKPRINKSLDSFQSAWNCHPVRTEHQWSPERMWQNGMLHLRNQNLTAVQSLLHENLTLSEDDIVWYGFDPGAPAHDLAELSQVLVDDINIEPIAGVDDVDPLRQSDSMGIDIYCDLLNLVNASL